MIPLCLFYKSTKRRFLSEIHFTKYYNWGKGIPIFESTPLYIFYDPLYNTFGISNEVQ